MRDLQRRASELYRAGSYEEARDTCKECHELALAHFGADHPVTASATNNLALMYKSLGEQSMAVAMYRTSLDGYRAALGANHRSTATAASNLALALRDLGGDEQLDEARSLLEDALRARESELGAGHPEVAVEQQHLASVSRLAGDLDGAATLLEKARDPQTHPLRPATPHTRP